MIFRSDAQFRPHLFQPGQTVRHRRYGYRGVVVAADGGCVANEDWYRSNQTQPPRDQPWYHVLVHGSLATTYAAEENLEPDACGEPVDHPLVIHFFEGFQAGKHIRNAEPWPDM